MGQSEENIQDAMIRKATDELYEGKITWLQYLDRLLEAINE